MIENTERSGGKVKTKENFLLQMNKISSEHSRINISLLKKLLFSFDGCLVFLQKNIIKLWRYLCYTNCDFSTLLWESLEWYWKYKWHFNFAKSIILLRSREKKFFGKCDYDVQIYLSLNLFRRASFNKKT